MSKKFDKVSPKDISEEKFNQLIDSLPSSGLMTKQNKKISVDNPSDPLAFNQADTTNIIPKRNDIFEYKKLDEETNNELFDDPESFIEVFVYEAGGLSFGIPVSSVTEITNEYAPVSKLDGFIRSCLGTCQYRGKLIPIFDSEAAYLKTAKNVSLKQKVEKNLLKNPIITVNYNDVMFALTMESHIGLVKVALKRTGTKQVKINDEFLDEIVWYNDKNLYIFSPEKIAEVVYRELKNQIVATKEANTELVSEAEDQNAYNLIDYLIAKIRESYVAIEITKVIEVIEGFEVTSLYKVSDFIRGLINLRGQVLACIDLSKYLGFELMVIDERNKFIVISEGGSDFALCVDELIGIKGLDWKTFQETDKVFPEDVSKFFPSFIEESEQIKLIMKPELFVNSETLLPYSKN